MLKQFKEAVQNFYSNHIEPSIPAVKEAASNFFANVFNREPGQGPRMQAALGLTNTNTGPSASPV